MRNTTRVKRVTKTGWWLVCTASCGAYQGVTTEAPRDATVTDARTSVLDAHTDTDANVTPDDAVPGDTAVSADGNDGAVAIDEPDAGTDALVTIDVVISAADVNDAGADVTSTNDATADAVTAVDVIDAARTDVLAVDATDATVAPDGDASPADAEDPGMWVSLGDGPCHPRQRAVARQLGIHVDPDAGPIEWLTNPPASGPHYPLWTRWGVWDGIARGNWVHNLEHGGVVMLHRCATVGACPADRDALGAVVAALPVDPTCVAPVRVRVVVDDDALIETPIAAAAWGWLYAAECIDAPSLTAFYTQHHDMGTEDTCADGYVP